MRNAKVKAAKDPKWEPIPDYGHVMTVEEFYECCDDGGFIDYDGTGNYAVKDMMSNVEITPSKILKIGINKRFTHVVWFNR